MPRFILSLSIFYYFFKHAMFWNSDIRTSKEEVDFYIYFNFVKTSGGNVPQESYPCPHRKLLQCTIFLFVISISLSVKNRQKMD